MNGLVYKDFRLFFKSVDKKLMLFPAAAVILLMLKAGAYAGLFATIFLAMVTGIQNVMSFASDEKVDWKKIQLTMPVGSFSAVGSKYLSVLLTLCVSVGAGLLFFLISGIVYGFDWAVLLISIAAAWIVPVVWTAICFPLNYWFGFRSAQMAGVIVVLPIVSLINYFEDGPGLASLTAALSSNLTAGFVVSVLAFAVSYLISVMGYRQKK